MRAASTAAFFALSTPTVATGTPGGICTIESSASSPSSTDIDERSGTPITGSSVCAATTPGSAAARPAPQISTRRPAVRGRPRVLGDRVRRAMRRANLELPGDAARVELVERRLHPLAIRLRADQDADDRISHRSPPRCRFGSARLRMSPCRPLHRLARAPPGSVGERCHREDTSAVRDQGSVTYRRAAVEDERAGGLGLGEPLIAAPA